LGGSLAGLGTDRAKAVAERDGAVGLWQTRTHFTGEEDGSEEHVLRRPARFTTGG